MLERTPGVEAHRVVFGHRQAFAAQRVVRQVGQASEHKAFGPQVGVGFAKEGFAFADRVELDFNIDAAGRLDEVVAALQDLQLGALCVECAGGWRRVW
jgi:hypothetical protein